MAKSPELKTSKGTVRCFQDMNTEYIYRVSYDNLRGDGERAYC